ncbi:PGF-CTERM sorting domain-containing protein [Halorientalis brevis]|uniref:PGF-CTERM sorting domain-containing protein n=1 Tax=Halorientalis brevis TaxID=1126241 RepID=A0ABD6CA09_9EURY|nr:PGF-CTERM sorting domain-containing protein [Halorientalis brevis]
MNRSYVVTMAVVALTVFSAVTPAAGATAAESPERSFVVDVHEDGSATVTMTTTFDLASQNESDAFEQLKNDQQARERFRVRFRDRMQRVAADAANATGREMSITDATVDLRTVGATGVVELSVTWDGLAAVEGDTLTITEPFASGFTPDRPLKLIVPDEYAVTSMAPAADSSLDGTATWKAGSPLDGFAVTVEPIDAGESGTTAASGTETSSGDGPGFGTGLAITAILGTGYLALRRF